MKEIPISKRNIIVAIILAVVIALGIIAIQALPLHNRSQSSVSNQEDNLASKALSLHCKLSSNVDYRNDKETWLNDVCAESTPTGCQLITAEPMRCGQIQEEKPMSPQRHSLRKGSGNSYRTSLEDVGCTLGPLACSNKIQDTAYVAVVKTENGWKFDRFLLEPEIKAILARQAMTITPVKEGK